MNFKEHSNSEYVTVKPVSNHINRTNPPATNNNNNNNNNNNKRTKYGVNTLIILSSLCKPALSAAPPVKKVQKNTNYKQKCWNIKCDPLITHNLHYVQKHKSQKDMIQGHLYLRETRQTNTSTPFQ